MDSRKVLIADDDPNIVELIDETLTQYNYNVIKADNGYSALYKAKEENPGLIILDLILPRMDGIKTCSRLKESNITKNIPVLILSGNTSKETIVKLLKLGIKNYLAKPFDITELVKRVNESYSGSHLKNKEDMGLKYKIVRTDDILNVILKGNFEKGDDDILISELEVKITEGIKKVILNLIGLSSLSTEELKYIEKIVETLKQYKIKVRISAGDKKSLRYNLLKNSSVADDLMEY